MQHPSLRDWAALEGYFVSIVYSDGTRADFRPRRELVDCVLSHRRVIGHRRWGMVHLYFRAGLTQREIAGVFGLNRQMVAYELRRAFGLVSEHLQKRRRGRKQRHRNRTLTPSGPDC